MTKRLFLDLVMVVVLLLGMAFQLTGDFWHELIGMAFFGLFVWHTGWNAWWYTSLHQGKYTPRRYLSTLTNLSLLVVVLTLSVTGFLQSDIIADAVGAKLDKAIGKVPLFNLSIRDLHALSAYWLVVWAAVHLGLHWSTVMNIVSRKTGLAICGPLRTPVLRGLGFAIAIYGIYFSFDRELGSKLIAYFSFDFWDFRKNTFGFFAGYTAVIGLYAWLAHHSVMVLRKLKKRNA